MTTFGTPSNPLTKIEKVGLLASSGRAYNAREPTRLTHTGHGQAVEFGKTYTST